MDLLKTLKNLLISPWAIRAILLIVVAQGLWFAFSYQPSIFDEARHIGFIDLYTEQLSPFIDVQEERYDHLGEVTREPSYLYYYVMSFPLRLIQYITSSFMAAVIFLRILHIAAFALGIYLYDKTLVRLGFSVAISRLSLLALVLTPAVAVLPGAITYDNITFLMSGLLMYFASGVVMKKSKLNVRNSLMILVVMVFGVLFKYTFLALAVPVFLVLFWCVIRGKLKLALRKKDLKDKFNVILAIMFLGGLVLFIERPLANTIEYGYVIPKCSQVMETERCLKNYTERRNITARQNKPDDFEAVNFYEFTVSDWAQNMVVTQIRLNFWNPPSRILLLMYSSAFFSGIFLLVYYLRDLAKRRGFVFSLVSIVSLSLVLLVSNYRAYASLAMVVATSSRYLLPVEPLFIALVIWCAHRFLPSNKHLRILILSTGLLILVFRGGVYTYERNVDEAVRWNNYVEVVDS
jgi:hypothetical protein